MLSALAEKIIRACRRAHKKGLITPVAWNFLIIESGVVASDVGDIYVSEGEEICPLGAVLLGRKRRSEDFAYVFDDGCSVLKVSSQWTYGFLSASPRVSLPKKPNRHFSREYIRGFKVGLEVRAVIYSEPPTKKKRSVKCLAP